MSSAISAAVWSFSARRSGSMPPCAMMSASAGSGFARIGAGLSPTSRRNRVNTAARRASSTR